MSSRTRLSCDLVEEILSRVDAISLVRFRLVCRQWNSLFDDPRFVQKHLSLHRCSRQGFVLWERLKVRNFMHMDVDTHHDDEHHEFITSPVKLHELVVENSYLSISQMFHCDGLLLCVADPKVMVFNPCLGQKRLIETDGHHKGTFRICTFGLGYGKNNAYKIVSFVTGQAFANHSLVAIYDFTSGAWRVLQRYRCAMFDWSVRKNVSSTGTSLKGTSYFFAVRRNRTVCFIQSFDFSEESFESLGELPFCYADGNYYALSVLGGERLSVLEQRFASTARTEIWVTSKIEEGVKVSWSKFMNFETDHGIVNYSRYFIGDDDKVVLCVSRGTSRGTVYIVANDTAHRSILNGRDRLNNFEACNYVPSLVPVP